VHRECAGIAFHNDEVVIRDLLEDGYSLEDAQDYSIVGCSEPTGTGNNNGYTATNGILPAAILELVLNEGKRYVTGWKQVESPVASISSFKTFEDVKKAFIEQLSRAVENSVKAGYLKDQVVAENFPLPLLSSTIEGCVESGEDVTRGGARYNHVAIGTSSLSTGSDSLAAIRWAVFEQKLLTMEELGECLRSNFQGKEDIRQRLLHAPKYGNDDSFADELAVWVADVHNKEVRKHRFWMGGVHRPYILSSATHVAWGATIGASADGRLAGTPLSSGITPTNGTERNGLTAVLRSAAKVGAIPVSDGMILNAIINPVTIKTEEGLSKFASLVEGYFALGGRQVQFNPIGKGMLLDAQKHPENYTELVVKVSGFSFRFIDLPKRVQDDVIARTEFSLA
jgi:pyruvate-formate lyase